MPKKNPDKKILPTIFVSSFAALVLIQAIAATALFLTPLPAQAQAAPKNFSMNLTVPLPTLNSATVKFNGDTGPIAAYIKAIYNFAVGAVGIVAAVVLMIGGMMWITAGGNASTVSEAKSMITAAITGLVLVLTSYLLLSQINPALVNLSSNINGINVPEVNQASGAETNLVGCEWVESIANLPTTGCLASDNSKCTEPKPENLNNPGCCCKYKPITDDCAWSSNTCADGYEATDPGKYSDNNLRTCGTETNNGNLSYCCCRILEWNDWKFDPGIDRQLGQADPSLRTLLGCMRKQLSRTQGRVTSISDSAVVHPSSMDKCMGSSYSKPPCAHTTGSCHYGCGGKNNEFSCAADFGQEDSAAVIDAANFCGAGYVLPEYDPPHVHVSTQACPHN